MTTSANTKSPVRKNAVLFGNGLIRTLGSPSSTDLLKETVCPPCNDCEGCNQGDYCPFMEQGDYLPFPLIYEYLILKKQKRHPETDMLKYLPGCVIKSGKNWKNSPRRSIPAPSYTSLPVSR